MAKKRKKGEKAETYEWVPPEFNEEEFLKKDLRSTKSLIHGRPCHPVRHSVLRHRSAPWRRAVGGDPCHIRRRRSAEEAISVPWDKGI